MKIIYSRTIYIIYNINSYRYQNVATDIHDDIYECLRMSKVHRFVFGAQFKFIIAFEFMIHRRESEVHHDYVCSIVQFIPLTS